MDAPLQLWTGKVMHARLRPVVNNFVYRAFWLKLRIDVPVEDNALFGIEKTRPLSIRWRDYGARDGSHPLAWVRATLAAEGIAADGAVWLQTFPRLWGYAFNPVSFWYCHAADGSLRAVLAEVNNTFGDWHIYVLTSPDGGPLTADSRPHCRKLMHVSPFCAITGHYEFRIAANSVTIDFHDAEGCLIKTAIAGTAQAASTSNLLRAIAAHPLMSFGVMARIHWQALRLFWKRLHFYRQPGLHRGEVSRSETRLENKA